MKKRLNKTLITFLCAISLMACEKDEERTIINVQSASTLTASGSSFVLLKENAADEIVAFSWSPSDFGYDAAVIYSLQFDSAGNNFAEPENVVIDDSMEKSYTVAELNTLAGRLKLLPDVADDMEVRVKAEVSEDVEPVYSNVVKITVTPYSDYVEPAYIYAPGAYQGWDPGTAAAIISVENNGIYTGYVTFTDPASLEFKFTSERSWGGTNYGSGGTNILSPDGSASNLSVPEPYTYKLVANLNDLTWSAESYSWGIIGDATTGGWSTDTDMTYNSTDRVWEITADLAAGELKFRLNDDWATNYGDDDTSDNLLNPGGANIPIAAAGSYTIIMDLKDIDNPTYSITLN